MRKKVIVIGSGFGGLGAAIRLAAQGYEVEIFEKRDQIGGRAYQYEINGFKFDGGPTVLTAPFMFDELFQLAGLRREDYLTLVPLDPFYRIFDDQGRQFDYYRSKEDNLKEVERWNPSDRQGYLRMSQRIHDIFNNLYPYTEKPMMNPVDMVNMMPFIIRLMAIEGVFPFVSRYIRDPFLRQAFSFHPLLVGGNPFSTPSLYTLIAQFEKQWGVHYALGGTGAVVRALGTLFEQLGGCIHLNTEVAEIVIEGRRAAGIRLSDGTIQRADAVVCNAELAHAYRYLIPACHRRKYTDRHIDHLNYSMSLFVHYFGTSNSYLDSKLQHHNLILNGNYRRLMDDIFKNRPLREDFVLYLHMPSRTDPSIAPPGCGSFYVLSPVPNLTSPTDWEHLAGTYRDRIVNFLERNYLPDLSKNIVAEHSINPLHFRDTLNSYRGAAFSVLPSLLQLGWFRPHNRSEEFANLYFTGAGTHPGAGVPAVLASGKIAANLILQDVPLPQTSTVIMGTPGVDTVTGKEGLVS
jgi:phytoene desaturase